MDNAVRRGGDCGRRLDRSGIPPSVLVGMGCRPGPGKTAENLGLALKIHLAEEQDLSEGILEAIDMDTYRVEKKAAMKIALADKDAEIEPAPTDAYGHKSEPELNHLSNILESFNERFALCSPTPTELLNASEDHPLRLSL